jgi:hypothetical protein
LRGVLSKFRWPFEFFFEHIESKLKDFNFKFHVSFAFIFMNDVSLKPSSYWNGSSSMKIYEILGWNKVHPKIIFIILFHLWSVGSLFTIIHFASKVIQISWMNIHKIYHFKWIFNGGMDENFIYEKLNFHGI